MNDKPVRKERGLLVSIHDAGPASVDKVEQLRELLSRYVPPSNIAILAVPNHWGEAPIRAGTPFAEKLRAWAQDGSEIFVHGWFHRDDSAYSAGLARWKARHMTAGEGEFLGLDEAESLRRMSEGKKLIEDITGTASAGFIAPAWLYGPGALSALGKAGFALAEDHWKVWSPVSQATLCSGPVLTWASRSRGRIASSLAVARLLPLALRAQQIVRVAVHPGDTTVPALLASIERAVANLARHRSSIRYADL